MALRHALRVVVVTCSSQRKW